MRNAFIATAALAVLSSAASATESIEQRPALSFEATYTAEAWNLRADDLSPHFAYLDNLDLIATLDGEALFGIGGLQLFAYAVYDNGHALNEGIANTLQGISYIEAPRGLRMYQAWAQWQLGRFVSLRAGLYEVNSDFDAIETACLFINSSQGMGPDFSQSGLNGPSTYPATSVGARARIELENWTLRLAVLDAVPGDLARPNRTAVRWDSSEGLLYLGELNYRTTGGARLGLGYWRYSEAFETLAPGAAGEGVLATNDGVYVLAETATLAARRGGLRAFIRAGRASADVNAIATYVGGGIAWTGFARHADEIGVAIGRARVGEPWRGLLQADGIQTERAETIAEITMRVPVGDHLVVQPDVQYVRQPGALTGRDAIWAFGLRLQVGLAFAR